MINSQTAITLQSYDLLSIYVTYTHIHSHTHDIEVPRQGDIIIQLTIVTA